MKKKEIWIVDDDNIYQIIVRKIIGKMELFSSFSSYKNGKDAIDALKKAIENNENMMWPGHVTEGIVQDE